MSGKGFPWTSGQQVRQMPMAGMGGPGSGMAQVPFQPMTMEDFQRWLEFQGAGGFGMGPYGYPLAYGITPNGQQNHMLNRQWGFNGMGNQPFGWGAGLPKR